MAKETANTETPATRDRGIVVNATLTADEFAVFDDLRWTLRAEKRSDLVRQAISEFVAKHGKVGAEPTDSAR